MKSIHFNDKKTGDEINIAYSDYGKGQPVILIHGWPSSREMWEYQINDIVTAGYRLIKYDRRGFGKSSKPWTGYDYETLSEDLHELIMRLDLHDVILVGFSMGGGEVVKYIARHGEDRVAKIALISSIIPFLQKSPSNPEGADQDVFDEMIKGVQNDRMGFLDEFGKKFFGVGFLTQPVSTPFLHHFLELAAKATQQSTIECIKSFSRTDFREDVKNITVPTLLIHGDNDKIVPFEISTERTAKMIQQAELVVYEGAPHGLFYTHKEQFNADLLNFFVGLKHVDEPEENTALVTPF